MRVPYFLDEKLKVGIFGFTGCAGDQLVIIHDEDRLLEYFQGAIICDFVMASSNPDRETHLDIALVEGTINTEDEIKELKEIRERADVLVAIGSCAVHGGIQGAFDEEWQERYDKIYGDVIELTQALPPKPLSDFVKVDFYVPGCPIDPDQIYKIFARAIHGLTPEIQNRPVCEDCRQQENICLLNEGTLCLGPITATGCKAACPSNGVACMGCFGLYEGANIPGFIKKGQNLGYSDEVLIRRMSCHGGTTLKRKLKQLEVMSK